MLKAAKAGDDHNRNTKDGKAEFAGGYLNRLEVVPGRRSRRLEEEEGKCHKEEHPGGDHKCIEVGALRQFQICQ